MKRDAAGRGGFDMERIPPKRRLLEWEKESPPLGWFASLWRRREYQLLRMLGVPLFRLLGLWRRGLENALDVRVRRLYVPAEVSGSLAGMRFLLLTDLHLDRDPDPVPRLLEVLESLDRVDAVLLGGDYVYRTRGEPSGAIAAMRRILPVLNALSRAGVLAVLGNHDTWRMVEELERDGTVRFLVNEAWPVERAGGRVWIVGVDDSYHYGSADYEKAVRDVPAGEPRILLSHSPDVLPSLPPDPDLRFVLCGHTHGGQIRLPLLGPVVTHCRLGSDYVDGCWRYGDTEGYTSNGVGVSCMPVRFGCPPEVVLVSFTRGGGEEELR